MFRQETFRKELKKGIPSAMFRVADNEEERKSKIRRILSRRLWIRNILEKNRSNSATENRITKDDCQSYHKEKERFIVCAVS